MFNKDLSTKQTCTHSPSWPIWNDNPTAADVVGGVDGQQRQRQERRQSLLVLDWEHNMGNLAHGRMTWERGRITIEGSTGKDTEFIQLSPRTYRARARRSLLTRPRRCLESSLNGFT